MERAEAIEVIGDGHAIITPEYAEETCKALGVAFDPNLVTRYRSDRPVTSKGLTMTKDHEDSEGVYTLTLSYYITAALGLGQPGNEYSGRGSQARANAEAVAAKLGFAVA